jgi:putative membrane protein
MPAPMPSSNDLAWTRTQLADDRTALAVTRTIVALDRTLMAWVRTGTALISFGFTIYKFFQYLRNDKLMNDADRLLGPRGVAMLLIGLGVGSLLMATIEYRNQSKALRAKYHEYGPFHTSIALAVAVVLSGLGVLGFILVFLRQ